MVSFILLALMFVEWWNWIQVTILELNALTWQHMYKSNSWISGPIHCIQTRSVSGSDSRARPVLAWTHRFFGAQAKISAPFLNTTSKGGTRTPVLATALIWTWICQTEFPRFFPTPPFIPLALNWLTRKRLLLGHQAVRTMSFSLPGYGLFSTPAYK